MRDGRAPIPKTEHVSRVMSANKSKDTRPELSLRKLLWRMNVRGYRLHTKSVPGRPDITFARMKLAVLVHGCFWHRCPKCALPLPKSNTAFWKAKFERNKARDTRKERELKEAGWKVLTIWECEIRKDSKKAANKVIRALKARAASKESARASR